LGFGFGAGFSFGGTFGHFSGKWLVVNCLRGGSQVIF
jgi:hypothetical protein